MTPKPGSAAAHSGTAIGRAIELYHEDPKRSPASILAQVAQESKTGEGTPNGHPFDQYRRGKVKKVLQAYVEDFRCRIGVKLTEYRVSFEIEGVTFTGTMDQVRLEKGYMRPWDLKLITPPGESATRSYMMQLAGYTVGLAEDPISKGYFVKPGGIMRLTDFLEAEDGARPQVFYESAELQSLRVCRSLLAIAARKVKRLLSGGEIGLTPGEHCGYCDYTGPGTCTVHYEV